MLVLNQSGIRGFLTCFKWQMLLVKKERIQMQLDLTFWMLPSISVRGDKKCLSLPRVRLYNNCKFVSQTYFAYIKTSHCLSHGCHWWSLFSSTITIFWKDTIQQLAKILGSIQGNDIFLSLVRKAEDRSRDLEDTPVWASRLITAISYIMQPFPQS